MSRTEWCISAYVLLLCVLTYKLTLEVKYLKEDGITIRNAPWSVLQPAVSIWQRPRRSVAREASAAHNVARGLQATETGAAIAAPQAKPPADNQTCSCKAASSNAAACQLSGPVRDCCCDYASVEQVNRDTVNPLLRRLVQMPFMRYFKVTLYCDCPFWPDDGMCAMRDCSVCECPPDEVPQLWKDAEAGGEGACLSNVATSAAQVKKVDAPTRARLLKHIRGWRGFNNPWMPAREEEDMDFSYINLQQNPERYTGYKGEAAARIWNAIYTQSCFADIHANDTCAERRVFHRLVSGMHASISAHIANDYLLDEFTGRWGQNLGEFERRLGNPEVASRVENLYFTYLFTLRAVQKAGPLLQALEFSSGYGEEDAQTAVLVKRLVNSEALLKACPIPFHEGRLWKGEDALALREQLQTSFQNITSIMDCVGCEKCKLWGKLQLMGIATSLKILFDSSDCGAAEPSGKSDLVLERNEVIALFNLLERLSTSIEIVRQMSLKLLDDEQATSHSSLGAIEAVTEGHPLFFHPST